MKILVTGVAGAIGSHLAERLLAENHEVIGIDALTPYYSPEIKKINAEDVKQAGGKVHILNLATENFDHLLENVEVVFHLAAQPGVSTATPFEDYLQNNIVATERLLQTVKKSKTLKLFVHASTSSVYGKQANGDETTEPRPTSYYGVTKLAAEQLAMAYYREQDLPVTVLRFFSVYGERERPEELYHKLIKAIHEDKPFTLHEGSLEHVRSYTYIRDIIDGCMLILKNIVKAVGHIFNLGNDKTMTTAEGIALIEKIMGKKGNFVIVPRRVGDQIETSADITKMRKFFGYNPTTSPEEGLTNQVRWYTAKIHGRI